MTRNIFPQGDLLAVRLAGVALVLLAAPSLAIADVKVAIVPTVAVNLDPARIDTLSQDLADALSAELQVEATGGLEVRRLLPAEGVPPDCHTKKECIADVGKRVGAQQLLFVGMVDATGSGAVQVDSIWVDVATAASQARPPLDIPVLSEAKSRFQSAAHQLLPDAKQRPKPKTPGGVVGGHMTPEVPRHFTSTTYVLAGVSLVGVGVGVGFGLAARGKYDDCEKTLCTQSQKDAIRTKTIIADSGFALALGGAIAATILYATSSKESHLVVSPSPGGLALAAVGRF